MLRFILLLAFCQVTLQNRNLNSPMAALLHRYLNAPVATPENPYLNAPIVTVVLELKPAPDKELEDIYEEVGMLFRQYESDYDIFFKRSNFKRLEDYDSHGLMRVKYQIRGLNCVQFQQFLLGIDSDKYHIEIAHVFCFGYSYSICMVDSCPKDTFPNFVKKSDV